VYAAVIQLKKMTSVKRLTGMCVIRALSTCTTYARLAIGILKQMTLYTPMMTGGIYAKNVQKIWHIASIAGNIRLTE
jgi:hypothetical protein